MKTYNLIIILLLAVASSAFAIPNPAAVFCGECGYQYEIRTDPNGDQYGVCIFPDGSECEGWDYFCKCNPGQFGCNGDCNCHWPCPNRIIYVDDDANGLNDGSSWQNAYNFLQDALADANSSPKPVQIRVAQGIYKPDQGANQTPGDRTASFQLINGVTLKGAYAGLGQPDPNERDIEAYETILSGDLDGNDIDVNDPCDLLNEPTRAENSYHIFYHPNGLNLDNTAVMDGFIITAGNANILISPNFQGGGMYNYYCSPSVNNCTFSENSAYQDGGGMYNIFSSPNVTNCTFSENSVESRGGAMCNLYGSPSINHCTFSENSAVRGGGMYNSNNNPIVNNCTFTANSARWHGGGMSNDGGRPTVTNCKFTQNSAKDGGGIHNSHGSPNVNNCTFIKNSAVESGGGMDNDNYTTPRVTNCTFSENSGRNGGGMCNEGGRSTVTNCKFRQNSASEWGGGMDNSDCSPNITNCTFTGNSARYGGGINNRYDRSSPTINNCTFSGNSAVRPGGGMRNFFSGRPLVINCIFWDNVPSEIDGYKTPIVTYSNVQGGWYGEGNIDADPCFFDPGCWDPNGTPDDPNDDFWINGDYHLKSQAGRWDPNSESWVKDDVTSPCIDAGDPLDPIGHEPFPNGGIINMGAYGGTAEASKSYFGEPICETIIAGDINGDCMVNLKDFAFIALHWLEGDTIDEGRGTRNER